MAAELFMSMTNTKMQQVPYKGSSAAHPDREAADGPHRPVEVQLASGVGRRATSPVSREMAPSRVLAPVATTTTQPLPEAT